MIGSELPKGWKLVPLKEITSIIRGVSYPKEEAKLHPEENYVHILRGGNIQDGKIVFETDDNVYVNSSLVGEEQFVLKDDVVIVASTGSKKVIGKAATIEEDSRCISFGAFLLLLRTNVIDKRFHSYFFQTQYYRNTISSLAGGININNIKKEHIENLQIPLPPLTEQKQIAEKLDKLFDQIETIKEASNKIPELLKNFRQQVLTYAVTGKLTDSDYESWELKTLDEIAIPKAGYAFKATDFIDNGIQVIRMGNLYDNKLSLDRNPVFVPKNYDTDIIERSRVKRNDILLTLTGTKYKRDYGYAIKIDTDEVLLLNQRILSLTPLIDPDYLLLVLRSDEFRNQFFEFETGGVNQGNVGVKNVMTIKLHIPSPRIQEEIVRRTKILFNILDNVERRYNILCEKLDKLPQALLGKAFKGELIL